MNSSPQDPTIVLVHGAWADGSCWSKVILPLRKQGLKVTAAPIPLTSLTDDVAALQVPHLDVEDRPSPPLVLAVEFFNDPVAAFEGDH